jgi:hypothetical protein
MDESEPELLAAPARGDAEAFGRFYRRHERRVLGCAIAPPLGGRRRIAIRFARSRAGAHTLNQTVLFALEREQHGSDPVAAR